MEYLEIIECRGDFWLKLEDAMEKASGGIPIESLAEMKLRDVVSILAQNGIRMTYDKEWHVSRLNPLI